MVELLPRLSISRSIGTMALLLLAVGASCGSGVGPPRARNSVVESSAATTSPMPEPQAAVVRNDPRLVRGVQPTEVDLTGSIEASEIASVLDFGVGAGGYPICVDFFGGSGPETSVGPGVAVFNGFQASSLPVEGAVGSQIDVCLVRSGPIKGSLRLANGETIDLPAAGESATGNGVELHHREVFVPGEETIEIATFPGAPLGRYELLLDDPADTISIPIEFDSAVARGVEARNFLYEAYDFDFGSPETTHQAYGGVVYGFTGYAPESAVSVVIYRSPRQEDTTYLLGGPHQLASTVVVPVDQRGEAILIIPVDSQSSGHCFVLRTVADALAASDPPPGERPGLDAADPATFCVS